MAGFYYILIKKRLLISKQRIFPFKMTDYLILSMLKICNNPGIILSDPKNALSRSSYGCRIQVKENTKEKKLNEERKKDFYDRKES